MPGPSAGGNLEDEMDSGVATMEDFGGFRSLRHVLKTLGSFSEALKGFGKL